LLYLINISQSILKGSIVTFQLFFATVVLSIPLGLMVTFLRISKIRILNYVAEAYIWLLRGTPLLLQLIFIYYALPMFKFVIPLSKFKWFGMTLSDVVVNGFTLSDMNAAILAFALNYAAYFAEIFRAGIQSIDKGQFEASKALGMSYSQTMRRIILPQMVRRVLPPVSNETITLVKDTSLIYAIGMSEILKAAKGAATRDFTIIPYIPAAIIYLLMTLILTAVFKKLEQRYALHE